MILHIVRAATEHPEALGRVDDEEALDEVFALGAEGLGEAVAPFENELHLLHRVVVDERRSPVQELVDEHAHGPPVNAPVVPVPGHHLGREVVGRAARREGFLALLQNLCEPKVDNFDVPLRVDEQVLRLEVAVRNLRLLHVSERHHNAADEESAVAFVDVVLLKVDKELAAAYALEEHEERALVPVRAVQPHDVGMLAHEEELLLAHDVLLHLHLDDVGLAHHLERVQVVLAFSLAHEEYLPESTLAEDAKGLEGVEIEMEGALRLREALHHAFLEHRFERAERLVESLAAKLQRGARPDRLDRCAPPLAVEQRELPKVIPRPQPLVLRPARLVEDANRASLEHIKRIPLFALRHDHVLVVKHLHLERVSHLLTRRLLQR
mmetsp:Transcript_23756/g.77246  ORF Transcript_23756/g.77246 Transcript_23756/m.77246 type:complete len:381 (+) Transcript_23756:1416-2558(+)